MGQYVAAQSDSRTVFFSVFICGCGLAQGRGRGRPGRGIHGTLRAGTRHDLPCGGHRAAAGVRACGQRRARKGSTMLATMQRRGVRPSFSRPSGSHDTPFASLFRTLKDCPVYPTTPVASLDVARAWVAPVLQWYNDAHWLRGIRFTTPAARQAGTDSTSLHHRARVYHVAPRTHPSRWAGATRNWTRIARVTLNGTQADARSVRTANRRTASGRARARDPERSPQAEGRLIETGRAPQVRLTDRRARRSSILGPRGAKTRLACNGTTRTEGPDRSGTTSIGHVSGRSTMPVKGVNEGAWSVRRATRRLTS